MTERQGQAWVYRNTIHEYVLSNGECHGLGTSQVNNSHLFLSGGTVYDSLINVFIPLEQLENISCIAVKPITAEAKTVMYFCYKTEI